MSLFVFTTQDTQSTEYAQHDTLSTTLCCDVIFYKKKMTECERRAMSDKECERRCGDKELFKIASKFKIHQIVC